MPKRPSPVGTTRRKRAISNVIQFPRKRGRPKGPVDPFTGVARRIGNPDHAAALLARLIVRNQGCKPDHAVDMAMVALTMSREDWRKLPDDVAWFLDWRHSIAGPLRYWPSRVKVRDLLRRHSSGLRKGNR